MNNEYVRGLRAVALYIVILLFFTSFHLCKQAETHKQDNRWCYYNTFVLTRCSVFGRISDGFKQMDK